MSEIANGVERTKNIKLHISLTFVYKIIAIGLSYVLIPLMIKFLGVEKYGIWITIFSLVSWSVFFDFGLGNGLRNKLSEAVALHNIKLARIYISTGYIAVSLIAFCIFTLFMIVFPFLNWNKILNTYLFTNHFLSEVVFITVVFFIINFILSISKQMFYAYQKASLASFNTILINLFYIIFLYLLLQYNPAKKLLYLSIAYGLAMVFANILLTIYFFKQHKDVIPSRKYIDFSKVKEIGSLGIKFFIIQIAVLVIFSTDNIIIAQVLGPKEVTPYSIVFKLFSVITMVFGIIMTPLWSAYTDAYAKGDIEWIKNILKKLNLLMIPAIFVTVILIIFAKDIIYIWIGPQVEVSNMLVMLMGIYAIVAVWSNIYAYFVNGIGKINLQMYSSIIAAIINIPLSVLFSKYLNMGNAGVILGSIASLSIFAVLGPIQTYYILRDRHA